MASDETASVELPARIRAFVALRLSAEVIDAITEFAAKIGALGAQVAWVKPANFHRFMPAVLPTGTSF